MVEWDCMLFNLGIVVVYIFDEDVDVLFENFGLYWDVVLLFVMLFVGYSWVVICVFVDVFFVFVGVFVIVV